MVNKPLSKFYVVKRGINTLSKKQNNNKKQYILFLGGRKEEVHIDKITSRIQKLCYGLNMDYVDPVSIYLYMY